MSRAILRQLARIEEKGPRDPVNLESMSEDEQLDYRIATNGLEQTIAEDIGDETNQTAEAAEPDKQSGEELQSAPGPSAEAAASTPPVQTGPAPPPEPWKASYPGEPDPTFVPPQNQPWQQNAQFRPRLAPEPYPDPPRSRQSQEDDWEQKNFGSV
jgi:hypothetical protein